ncbi:MAG: hypothetical protein PHU63_01095 [Candidatus ainarchaeum sp.]|nr:hypothetical protein [Candidatus ainarchaeum sp.]
MILEILLFIVIIIFLYVLFKLRDPWIEGKISLSGSNTHLTVRAKEFVDKIEFKEKNPENKKEFTLFSRKNLKAGESIKFIFPHFSNSITIKIFKGNEKKDLIVKL